VLDPLGSTNTVNVAGHRRDPADGKRPGVVSLSCCNGFTDHANRPPEGSKQGEIELLAVLGRSRFNFPNLKDWYPWSTNTIAADGSVSITLEAPPCPEEGGGRASIPPPRTGSSAQSCRDGDRRRQGQPEPRYELTAADFEAGCWIPGRASPALILCWSPAVPFIGHLLALPGARLEREYPQDKFHFPFPDEGIQHSARRGQSN
jgi:hypothetical protein